ncbi:hypothetical protein HRI96_05830 [Treponema parvum]|uniref:Uncharacterized protein n=1 Tax=Treponema parvum TaxID=138851 RepID=A0A975IC93_9SPIR|nr:hypothetical protein [Treponema parvum]QTQ11761.1 hypothetical protein HRI96_05830 [Treponema parvum]QTQ16293.1 hypothetical protein HXT04_06095 [Treponema parvum]
MKRKFLVFLALLTFSVVFAQQYKIETVTYNITGATWKYSIEENIKIDKKRVFTSEQEFMNYFRDLQQRFYNERIFESATLDFTITAPDKTPQNDKESGDTGTLNSRPEQEGLYLVHITVTTVDSHHLLVVPYPKYNSNSGTNLKLKVKDTNFLGSMEELSGDISFAIETDDEDRGKDYVFGLSADFAIPFPAGVFKAKWINSWAASFTVGEDTPEWNVSTGIVLSLPFDKFSLDWTFKQSTAHDFDYIKYGDEFYYTEYAEFAIPITLHEIDNWGKVYYTPLISATYNWDTDGIDKNNDDLSSPFYKIGHGLSTERVNWYGNFRRGLSLKFDQYIGYNTQRYDIVPFVSGEAKIFLAFKYLGMNMDAYAFASKNSTTKIGGRLRGIKDDQKYSTGDPEIDSHYATRPDSAIVVNMDMPFHIFTFNFSDSKHLRFLRVFDCELQIAPFFDFALLRNKATNTHLWFKDGFYAGGLEFLVFPKKWRSLVVRASAGIDLGRIIVPSSYINKDWRKEVSKYEIEIGVGLHY